MPELPSRVWRFIVSWGLSQTGAGFVFTFNFVYLAQARALGPAAAGAVLAAAAAAGALVLPLGGLLADRLGTDRVTAAALLLTACGSVGFTAVHGPASAFIAAILFGAGWATSWNGMAAVFGGAVPPEKLDGVFAVNNVLQNMGFGIGAAAGGLIAHVAAPSSFAPGFVADAALRVAFALVLLSAGGLARAAQPHPRPPRGLLDPRLIGLAAIATLVVAAGFSQVTSAFADWTTLVTGSTALLGLALALNTLVIAVLQIPVLRWVMAGRRRMPMAAAGAALFAGAWLLALLATPDALLASMMVFGLGETLYVPVMSAMVNDLAPQAMRARYNGVYNLSNQVGSIVGPAAAGAVLAGGHAAALLVGLAVACALGGAAALAMQPLLAGIEGARA